MLVLGDVGAANVTEGGIRVHQPRIAQLLQRADVLLLHVKVFITRFVVLLK